MLSRGQVVDYKITECLDQAETSSDMKLPEVFLPAANREKTSQELYISLAVIHLAGETKKLTGL